jgi:hypothetical protein
MKTTFAENESPFHHTDSAPAADIKEIDEAIAAGRKVLAGLEEVTEALNSARKWGIWDILGGGLFSTLIKHSRIDKARAGINKVRRLMQQFRKELNDVQNQVELGIDISDFESFADIFLDGFIFDVIVQTKITDALAQARQAKANVFRVVNNLEGLRRTVLREQSSRAEL